MIFLKEKDRLEISKRFESLDKNVKLLFFTQELECLYCREAKQLLTELAQLSDKIKLEIYNFVTDKDIAANYQIDKIPAIVVMDETKDYGIRYFGIPSGYEFASILESIEIVSTGKTRLSDQNIEKIKTINSSVHIQVFVTPTCPYCPPAVLMGQEMAYINDNIRADMVEITEFPNLATKYNVRGVPRVVINENYHFEGALPESSYIEQVFQAINKKNKS